MHRLWNGRFHCQTNENGIHTKSYREIHLKNHKQKYRNYKFTIHSFFCKTNKMEKHFLRVSKGTCLHQVRVHFDQYTYSNKNGPSYCSFEYVFRWKHVEIVITNPDGPVSSRGLPNYSVGVPMFRAWTRICCRTTPFAE